MEHGWRLSSRGPYRAAGYAACDPLASQLNTCAPPPPKLMVNVVGPVAVTFAFVVGVHAIARPPPGRDLEASCE